MPMKKQALRNTLCIVIIFSLITSALFFPVPSADPAQETKLYFKDILSFYDTDYNQDTNLAYLSDIPPTGSNASSYPPLLIKEISLRNGLKCVDNDTFLQWALTWSINLLDELGFDDLIDELDGIEEILEQMKILLPNPLRVVECYEHTGNESIQLKGNINYDLYFRTKTGSQIHKNDRIKISVYTYGQSAIFPDEIANTTISLEPGIFQNTIQKSVTITNVSATINPNTLVLFAVEMIPGEKTITSLITNDYPILENLSKIGLKAIRNVANFTGITTIEDVFAFLDLLDELMNDDALGINLSIDDAVEVLESLISVSFLYDSADYPSSVTVPFRAAGETDDNSVVYYLHDSNNMDSTRPTAASQQIANLADSSISWTGEKITRNKILSDASAIVYINHKDLQFWSEAMVVEASLTYGNTTLDTDSITLEQKTSLSATQKPYRFIFDDIGTGVELEYGKKIGITISLKGEPSVNSFFRTIEVFYDSSEFASMLSFSISETDHIQVSGSRSPSNGKIIVADKVTYTLEVSSDLEDDITVSIQEKSFSSEEQDYWDISINPTSFSVGNAGEQALTVILSSLGTTIAAYDEDPLELTLDVIGNTGYDSIDLSAEVSDDAVTYDTLITIPKDKEIAHGENASFVFTIENNNSGLWRDSFIFSAEIDENISIEVTPLTFDNLDVGNKTNITVNVSIPDDTKIDEATISLTIISKRSQIQHEATVNFTIVGANIFESLFDYFEDIAESLGLTGAFGDYAPLVLVSIIIIVIFFILILMAFILTSKTVEVICIDRIKEIDPENTATYEITLKNRTNKPRSYLITSDLPLKTGSWDIQFSSDQIMIPAKQQRTIKAMVKATDEVQPGDWTEFLLFISTEGKSKKVTIPLFCSLSDGMASLSIKDVFHWPKSFSSNQKISTSLKVFNSGNTQARNVSVKLFINNKEKNKVEELIIPAGGYADITLPWIAEKGKNDLRIIVS